MADGRPVGYGINHRLAAFNHVLMIWWNSQRYSDEIMRYENMLGTLWVWMHSCLWGITILWCSKPYWVRLNIGIYSFIIYSFYSDMFTENWGYIGIPMAINQSRKCLDSVVFNMWLSYSWTSAFAECLAFEFCGFLKATNNFEAEVYCFLFLLFLSIFFF